MVSLQEPLQATAKCGVEPISSPRISFSSEFLDENNFISICPKRDVGEREKSGRNVDFEFLSGGSTTSNMMSADELFCEGKLLPSRHVEKLATLKTTAEVAAPTEIETSTNHDQDRRISWFLDDDPSPRPPTCTVLWKELLRLKKQRPSTLSSLSSSSSSSSSENSSTDERKKGGGERNKVANKVKKGLERTKSASIRIRPMINVPICTTRNASLPPLFSLRRSSGRLES
ncbi:hypothetical protein ACS0TY_023167 [Phlomoides rotata]